MPRFLLALLPLLATAACTPPPQHLDCHALRGAASLSATLYFGRDFSGGKLTDEERWQGFLAAEVTPRFPAGLTVLDGYGQWFNPHSGIVTHQHSSVLNIVTDRSEATLAKLDEIADAYKRLTGQLSVGIVLAPACAAF